LGENDETMNSNASTASLSVSAKSAFLFYAALMLVYFAAGAYLQASLGLLGIFLNQILLIGAPLALFSRAMGLDLLRWPAWRWPGWRELLASLAMIAALSYLIDQAIALQDKHFPPPAYLEAFFEELTAIHSWKEGVVKTIALALAPAFCEEMFFRGLLLPSWSRKFGWVAGNAFASLAFALAHGNLFYFHYYFILGFFLGWLFQWRGSLWLPILAHFANNAWTLLSSNLAGS